MGIIECIAAIIGSDVVVGIVTHLLARKKYKIENTDAETQVLQREIEFLSQRLEKVNVQLNKAVEEEIKHIKQIAKLEKELAFLKENKIIEE